MPCAWTVTEDALESVLFFCTTCSREIRFVKEGFGEPNPVPSGESFAPPETVLDYLGPCPE